MNFLVPEAVCLPIRKHIGLRKVRENPKRISGIREKLNVLALLYDTQLIVASLSIGLALLCVFRTAEKTRFSVRDFSSGKQCLTSQLAENGLVVEPRRVSTLYEIGTVDPNNIVFNPMWHRSCEAEMCSPSPREV